MPMIDAYAAAGTFADNHQLAVDLATTVMTIEEVPNIPMFRKNTAAFVHELPADSISNVDGEASYVRVQVLTNAGALDRDKQLAVQGRAPCRAAPVRGGLGRRPRTGRGCRCRRPGRWARRRTSCSASPLT